MWKNKNTGEDSGILYRLRQLFEEMFNADINEFSRVSGASEAELRNFLKGKLPKAEVLEKLTRNTGVSCKWLLIGEGDMLDAKSQEEENARNYIKSFEKIVGAIDLLANSSNNVSEANKILAESNSILITQLTAVLSQIKDTMSAGPVEYTKATGEAKPSAASDFTGDYNPKPENP